MKILSILLILLFLVACKQPALERTHQKAKDLKGKEICYLILLPPEISGYYCLKYKGNKLHQGIPK